MLFRPVEDFLNPGRAPSSLGLRSQNDGINLPTELESLERAISPNLFKIVSAQTLTMQEKDQWKT